MNKLARLTKRYRDFLDVGPLPTFTLPTPEASNRAIANLDPGVIEEFIDSYRAKTGVGQVACGETVQLEPEQYPTPPAAG